MLDRNEFEKSFKRTNTFIKTMSMFIFIMIIIVWSFYAFLGVKAYNAVQENNGSIATTLGKAYKEFQEAAK